MNIDFEKSHPAVNINEKRELYVGTLRVTAVLIVLLALLMIGMFVFLT